MARGRQGLVSYATLAAMMRLRAVVEFVIGAVLTLAVIRALTLAIFIIAVFVRGESSTVDWIAPLFTMLGAFIGVAIGMFLIRDAMRIWKDKGNH
jgi:hypothetical protein